MRREIKEGLSGIGAIISVVGIFVLLQFEIQASQPTYGTMILFLAGLFFVSLTGAIVFSRTGTKMEGSTGEWIVAGLINPIFLLMRKDKEEGELPINGEAQLRDEDYWNRPK